MELQHHKFGYAGKDMNFAVFSDDPCRVSYVESIAIPIGHTQFNSTGLNLEPGRNGLSSSSLMGIRRLSKCFCARTRSFSRIRSTTFRKKPEARSCSAFPT